jgi:CheY-like chemotaxis protein
MTHKEILLVEDNPDDVELTRIAFDEAKVANRLVVVRDGAEALDYLFARGAYADRDPADLPSIVLLDPTCRAWTGAKCCRRSARTRARAACRWWC